MKKSTIKLIVYTVLGVIASILFYQLELRPNPLSTSRVTGIISVGKYICPFIGFVYWLFCRQFDE